jgi:crotonobetainyl-CoA:carnitine CoA-transferase CaiB-like acyl-CoA transferase
MFECHNEAVKKLGEKQVSERIFDGIKVIDCASFIAGPAAATVMSDFGAEVVKIEPPGMGDPYRRRAVPNPANPLNPGFFFDARNKKSLALDLRTDAGRAVLHRLVEAADVFITAAGSASPMTISSI